MMMTPGSVRPPPPPPQAGMKAALVLLLVAVCLSGPCGADPEESSVLTVTSENWTLILEGHWMVELLNASCKPCAFVATKLHDPAVPCGLVWNDLIEAVFSKFRYAPWCPACQQIEADWENFAKRSSGLNVKVAKVDVTQQPGVSGRFFVTKLPTIFHAKDGVFRCYHGSRMVEDLHTFIAENKWNVIEPVAGWKSPSSVLMAGMSGLFYISGWIRQTHNYFTGPLGMSAWGSYIIFIMATLMIGLILGLMLVLLIDCFCPAKPKSEVLRSDIPRKDIEEVEKDPGDEKVSDEDVSEEDDDEEEIDEQAEGNEEAGNSNAEGSGENSAAEGSGTEEEDDVGTHVPPSSTPESESALRQRRSEAAADSGH